MGLENQGPAAIKDKKVPFLVIIRMHFIKSYKTWKEEEVFS